jgi:branched-subunit amino acid aminotransferase/4-amino-4-deoxychorismate lyase
VPADLPLSVVHEFVRVMFLLWVEGRIVSLDQFRIDPADEGLLFGRGAWESTRTINGVPWLWPYHIERLMRTAQLICIDLDPARLPDEKQVSEFVRSLTTQDLAVRLNVTAGSPGKPGLVWMSAAPLHYPTASVRLRSCRSPVQKGQAYLTLKTFHYAARMRLGQDANAIGFDSALLIDTEGNLLEAAHANIFVRLNDGWATPISDGGLLPGTVRRYLLEHAPVPMREQTIPYALMAEVKEAFVTGSHFGIVPVVGIDNYQFSVGVETQDLIRWLEPAPSAGVQYRFKDYGKVRR